MKYFHPILCKACVSLDLLLVMRDEDLHFPPSVAKPSEDGGRDLATSERLFLSSSRMISEASPICFRRVPFPRPSMFRT